MPAQFIVGEKIFWELQNLFAQYETPTRGSNYTKPKKKRRKK